VLAFSVINILLCRTKIIYSKNYFNLEVQKTEVYNAAYVQHYYCDVYIYIYIYIYIYQNYINHL